MFTLLKNTILILRSKTNRRDYDYLLRSVSFFFFKDRHSNWHIPAVRSFQYYNIPGIRISQSQCDLYLLSAEISLPALQRAEQIHSLATSCSSRVFFMLFWDGEQHEQHLLILKLETICLQNWLILSNLKISVGHSAASNFLKQQQLQQIERQHVDLVSHHSETRF